MNQEELKNNYILLSKVAKEKKYAQEYLGLLARRGDVGSIRIGKRWYTTPEWFAEFLSDAEIRKAEIKTPKSLMDTEQAAKVESEPAEVKVAEKIEIEKVFLPRAAEFVPRVLPQKIEMKRESGIITESIQMERREVELRVEPKSEVSWENFRSQEENAPKKIDEPKIETRKAESVTVASGPERPLQIKNKVETVAPVRKNSYDSLQLVKIRNNFHGRTRFLADISRGASLRKTSEMQKAIPHAYFTKKDSGVKNISKEEQSQASEDKAFQKWTFHPEEASPNFAGSAPRISLFPKFAFSMVAVLVLVLIFQFGLIFKNDLKKMVGFESGTVAGATDSKLDLSSVKNQSVNYLGNQGDKVKENISFSRVLIRVALEREGN
jgi:hypothetical protein